VFPTVPVESPVSVAAMLSTQTLFLPRWFGLVLVKVTFQ
jgi:hypothetical protein